jgi:hypothetical protein
MARYGGLEKSAIREQLMGSLLFASPLPSHSAGTWTRPLLALVVGHNSPSKLLDFASYAVCTARLRYIRKELDGNLALTSQKLYGQAIQAMQRTLNDPKLVTRDDTLAACVLLALYELCECPGDAAAGYTAHFAASARLIYLRGPSAHVSGLAHSSFLAIRSMGVSE